MVSTLISKEVQLKAANLVKVEAFRRKMKDRQAGFGGAAAEEDKTEIDEMSTKLEKLELPEETKAICDRELKKVKSLGPRNQEYHVSMNYL